MYSLMVFLESSSSMVMVINSCGSDPATGTLDSIVAPGSCLCGITYDGTSLLVAGGHMGAAKIFMQDPLTPSVFMSPEEG